MPLPKFEDYKAPWEIDADGNDVPEDDQVIDPAKLKKYTFGLLGDKERHQSAVAVERQRAEAAETALQSKIAESGTDDEKQAAARQKALDDARNEGKAESDLRALRLEVALDIPGITPAQARKLAKRLTGTTEDELKADAVELAELANITPAAADDEDDDDTDATARRKPVRVSTRGGEERQEAMASKPDLSDPATLDRLFPR